MWEIKHYGRNSKDFKELKDNFLSRYWSRNIQAEILRRFYSVSEYDRDKMSKEQYVLWACEDNKYLDFPLSERDIVGALSRHFGIEIAKHVLVKGVETIEEFIVILNAWEYLEKDGELRGIKVAKQEDTIKERYEDRRNVVTGQDQRRNIYDNRENQGKVYYENERDGRNTTGYNYNRRGGNWNDRNEVNTRNLEERPGRSQWENKGKAAPSRYQGREVEVRNNVIRTSEGAVRNDNLKWKRGIVGGLHAVPLEETKEKVTCEDEKKREISKDIEDEKEIKDNEKKMIDIEAQVEDASGGDKNQMGELLVKNNGDTNKDSRRVREEGNRSACGNGHVEWKDLVESEGEENQEMEPRRDSLISIDVIVGDEVKMKMEIDTGATYSCISKEMYEKLQVRKRILGELPVSKLKLRGAVKKRWIEVRRQVLIEIKWWNQKYYVVALVIDGLFLLAILGLDWLRENKMLIDCEENIVYTRGGYEDAKNKMMRLLQNKKEEKGDGEEKLMTLVGEDKKRLEKIVQEWGNKQRKDEQWGKIISEMGSRDEVWRGIKKYCLYGGLLFEEKIKTRNKWVFCVPRKEVDEILYKFYDENLHPGINKLQKMLSNTMVWKGMTREIKKYVRSCYKCQINKYKSCSFSGPWHSIIPREIGDFVAVDVLGPLVTSVYGYTCVLVFLDIFSKFAKLHGLERATSTTCITK